MTRQDQQLFEEVQRRLEERPRLTLRFRIAVVFGLFAAFITGITVGSILLLLRLRADIQLLEVAEKCAFEMQEARRFEKNFFLYGTSLRGARRHIDRADTLLKANRESLEEAIGTRAAESWLSDIERYEELLEVLADSNADTAQDEASQRVSEAELRRYGAAVLEAASDMIAQERRSMTSTIRTAMVGAGASLTFMFLLIVVLGYQLARQVIRPIGRFVQYVGRIGEGDFSPISPARQYRDEFSTLAIAVNRMLDELESRQEQLIQSRKMAAVGTLTAGIAHELNNPLHNISVTAETLLDEVDVASDGRRRTLLNDIFNQVQRASATVRNLLDFTRKEQPLFSSLSVPEVLETTLKLVGNELTFGNVKTHLEVAENLPPVQGSRRNLQQVFLNLFLNAIQAMPEGGNLTVSAKLDDGAIRVAVRDTGGGISEENLEKVFEPFFTTKEAGEGTGLGLSVSYSIVENHGGRLEVDSREGEGTTFFVILPVAGAAPPDSDAARPTPAAQRDMGSTKEAKG